VPTILLVHHTPSPALQELLVSARAGIGHPDVAAQAEAPITLVTRPALSAAVVDVLAAQGILLATPANIGYISGALKHFFDTIYYPCLDATKGLPFAAYVHGNLDATGAVRAIESITTGLGWHAVSPVLTVTGTPGKAERDAVYELAATLAATVAAG
jgi:NAD(P)H-dependent FMN reductase